MENENDHLRILPHPGKTKRRVMVDIMEENTRDHNVEENDCLRILPRPGRTKRRVLDDDEVEKEKDRLFPGRAKRRVMSRNEGEGWMMVITNQRRENCPPIQPPLSHKRKRRDPTYWW